MSKPNLEPGKPYIQPGSDQGPVSPHTTASQVIRRMLLPLAPNNQTYGFALITIIVIGFIGLIAALLLPKMQPANDPGASKTQ